jgi:CRP-like cAMP-binding protein
LTEEQLIWATSKLELQKYPPGSIVIQEGSSHGKFYLITKGGVEVILPSSDGQDFVVTNLRSGQYFGEIELLRGGASIATIRAAPYTGVEVAALDRETFTKLIAGSESTRAEIDHIVQERIRENIAGRKKAGNA